MKNSIENPTEGDLQIWWNPQVGSGCGEYVQYVDSPIQAHKLLETLALYDLFQLAQNIKPDFSNAGGLSVFEDGEWVDWQSPDGDTLQYTGGSTNNFTYDDVKQIHDIVKARVSK